MANDEFVRSLKREQVAVEALNARRIVGLRDEASFPLLPIAESQLSRIFTGYELHVEPQEEMGNVAAYVANYPLRMVLSDPTYEKAYRNEERTRFTIAHEIGHVFLHQAYLQVVGAKAARSNSQRLSLLSSRSEQQANWFAAEFLMPEHIVRQFDNPDALSEHCVVSRTTAELRMRELGLWPKKSPKVVRGFDDLRAKLIEQNASGTNNSGRASRLESWGTLHYDFAKDEFSAEVTPGANPSPASPIGAGWVIIGACNQLCVQCYGNAEELPKGHLSTAECMNVVDAIVRAQIMRVVISGGEPLLHPDIYAVIDRLAANNVSVILGTNGTYLNAGNVKRLAKCTRIEISLDAADASTNNQIRPSKRADGNAFNEAVKAIKLCLESRLNVRVLTTLNRRNQHQLVAMARLLTDIGVRDWSVSWTIPAGRAVRIFDDLRPQQHVVERNLSEVQTKFPWLRIRYSHRGPEFNRFYFLVLPDSQVATQDVIRSEKTTFGPMANFSIDSMWNDDNFDLAAHFSKWVADRIFPSA